MLAIILPLAALLIAGLSIAGIWYWWTTSRDADDSPPADRSEPDTPPVQDPVRHTDLEDDLSGSFFSRLADSFKSPSGEPVSSSSSGSLSATDSQITGVSPPMPAAPIGDAIEVMRIFRDLADGSLLVEINGQRYRRLADITDAQIGRRFIGNAQALARFALLGDLNIPDNWAEIPPESMSQVTPSTPPALPPVQRSTSPPPTDSARRGGLFSSGRSNSEAEPTPELSMVEQIEELLQFRLAATPELAQRSIHLRPAHDGGVRIEIDGSFFEGVGEVPDNQIREFIQSTIREWEARQ